MPLPNNDPLRKNLHSTLIVLIGSALLLVAATIWTAYSPCWTIGSFDRSILAAIAGIAATVQAKQNANEMVLFMDRDGMPSMCDGRKNVTIAIRGAVIDHEPDRHRSQSHT